MKYADELVIADSCLNYSSCRVDSLGTGICQAAEKYSYATYYPQGRLAIFRAFYERTLPLTRTINHVIESCTLCNRCNIQCYYVSELQPRRVMKALKEILSEREKQEVYAATEEDDFLRVLKSIAGEQWASNDPAILHSYKIKLFLSNITRFPKYVVLPSSESEVSKIIRLAAERNMQILPRSSGSSLMHIDFKDGLVIDFVRMKSMTIDPQNKWVEVEPGVSAHDVQEALEPYRLRMAIGEPAAGVIANQISTGIYSLFSYRYGVMSDHCISASFIDLEGNHFTTASDEFEDHFSSDTLGPMPKITCICTKMKLRVHSKGTNEEMILIPFKDLDEALETAKRMSVNRIGVGMGILSGEMLSTVLTLSREDEENLYDILKEYLKINYALLLLCERDEIDQIRDLLGNTSVILNRDEIKAIIDGIPAITSAESIFLLESEMYEEKPYNMIFGKALKYFLDAIVPEDGDEEYSMEYIDDKNLRKAFIKMLYKPCMNDVLHLFNFRENGARVARHLDFAPKLCFCDFSDADLIDEICSIYKQHADRYSLKNYLCFITPFDNGNWALIEYDMKFNKLDKLSVRDAKKAFFASENQLTELAESNPGRIFLSRNAFLRGFIQRNSVLPIQEKEYEHN
jgi:hypothetical protein